MVILRCLRCGQVLRVSELSVGRIEVNARASRAHERAADAAGRKRPDGRQCAVRHIGHVLNVLVLLRGVERLHGLIVPKRSACVAFGVSPSRARIARVQRVHALRDGKRAFVVHQGEFRKALEPNGIVEVVAGAQDTLLDTG